ncbi:unnamed protein product [Penicillium egyptiacum]|uniref:Uncharacterized protein n=1 Tax=Penicillium egyptiacum TaxID=1303716 RepID=A0A9W4KP49_9EURO|nr:unnamed protein product [Penicillium egyptiacum]
MKSEDEAMSQLAAMICGDDDDDEKDHKPLASLATPHKHDPVQAILAGAGVEYTHLNNEVIGSSRVEEDLSRRAELAPNDTTSDRQVFMSSQPFSQPAEDPMRFKYHPPEDVIRRQFCSMARRFGYADATEFALVVEGMTQAQRRACLDQWYGERREILLSSDENTLKEELIKDEQFPKEMDVKDERIKDEKGPKGESPGL